jgi:mono/diheme cytochrome c family protein
MRTPTSSNPLRAAAVAALVAGASVAATGCAGAEKDPDLVAGKQLFVKNCGSCHVLSRAGTKGVTGPNLDEAFRQPLQEGFGRDAVRGLVASQIGYPNRNGVMPAKLVKGKDAEDVAAYVASAASATGKDQGLLATAVKTAGSGKPIAAANGALTIPADPGGQLAFASKLATAPAGQLKVEMPNKSTTPHDIVIDGKGTGKVVSGGGVSSFTASFTPGKYQYYCSVPGHKQAGMIGTLTVK